MSVAILQESFRLGLSRLWSARAAFLSACFVAFSIAVALAEKKLELLGSASRSLEGPAFGFLIPLSLFALAHALSPKRLDEAAAPLARFGAPRRAVALGFVLSTALSSALLAASIAVATAFFANDPLAPALSDDLPAAAWIGLLTGAAYGALFSLGATFGARGGGRSLVLILDFVLGGSLGLLGALTPRSHALNLLGAPPPLEGLSQGASAAALVAMAITGAALAIYRCAR